MVAFVEVAVAGGRAHQGGLSHPEEEGAWKEAGISGQRSHHTEAARRNPTRLAITTRSTTRILTGGFTS